MQKKREIIKTNPYLLSISISRYNSRPNRVHFQILRLLSFFPMLGPSAPAEHQEETRADQEQGARDDDGNQRGSSQGGSFTERVCVAH